MLPVFGALAERAQRATEERARTSAVPASAAWQPSHAEQTGEPRPLGPMARSIVVRMYAVRGVWPWSQRAALERASDMATVVDEARRARAVYVAGLGPEGQAREVAELAQRERGEVAQLERASELYEKELRKR